MSKTIRVFSPATIGNIGPGFDVLGVAVKGMGDIVEVWETAGDKIVIVLDDSTTTGFVGTTLGSANASAVWGATPANVPVNLFINHILV